MARARRRNREHMRRTSVSDITPQQELRMRQRTRKCTLCGTWMTSKLYQPNSKHLDHILPVSQGGTHTHGNVRIICATCNLTRPRDGSDYAGMLTLWAQDPGFVSRSDGRANQETCRKGLHSWIPANIEPNTGTGTRKQRCKPCREARDQSRWQKRSQPRQCKCGAMFPAPGRTFMCPACTDATAHRAAELHASGMTWQQVAKAVGYASRNGEGVRYAAKRIGYTPAPPEPKPVQVRRCGCGQPVRGGRQCDPCATALAWRAVGMRSQGMTLLDIATALGYRSKSSVTNLMKTVVQIEQRMGRPPTMIFNTASSLSVTDSSSLSVVAW